MHKLIDIRILEILRKYSSPERRLSQNEIIKFLDMEYGIEIARGALAEYIAELREAGYIAGMRGVYSVNEFSDTELRLLIDGVMFGKHVPGADAKLLIDKLKKQSEYTMKNRVKYICYLEGINRTSNEKLYEVIDVIDEAIDKNRKIEVTQCYFGPDGELHDRGQSVVDPYYMVSEKLHYYLICNSGHNADLDIRRLDRISNVRILDDIREPIDKVYKQNQQFDLTDFLKEHIYMTYGSSIHFKLKIVKKRIGEYIDWFGKGYRVVDKDDDYIIIADKANENAVYYWALQYGEIVEVIEPERFRQRIRDGVEKLCDKYMK